MDTKINSIRIIGGGTAGASVACVLKQTFPEKDIRILEGRNIPTVGVGESTLGSINSFLQFLDIQEEDFLKYCDGSYKLSIRFENFKKNDGSYFHYPFGNAYYDQVAPDYNSWIYKKCLYPNTPDTDFADCMFPQMALVNQNKVVHDNVLPNYSIRNNAAYHFDATKLGEFLKEKFRKLGGRIIQENIVKIHHNEDGSIKELELDTQNKIKADLYIDCTGFRSLLLGQSMKEPFESYEDILPNNTAWATRQPYKNKRKELVGYTNCKAVENGWIWNIPLWSRMGTGYVYSNKYISDDDALKQLQKHIGTDELEFKKIPMRIGIHKRLWVKNVCAIGLSAGFIEPLESNGLLTIHVFLIQLLSILKKEIPNEFAIKHFNIATRRMFRGFSEFVAMHYALSDRTDTQYWRDIQNRDYPIEEKFFSEKSDFQLALRNKMEDGAWHPIGGFPCIANGMGWYSQIFENIKWNDGDSRIDYKKFYNHVAEHLDHRKKEWNKIADRCPTLYDYLNERFYKE